MNSSHNNNNSDNSSNNNNSPREGDGAPLDSAPSKLTVRGRPLRLIGRMASLKRDMAHP